MQNRASQKTRQKYSVGPQKGSATNSAGADQTMYFSGPFLCTFYLTNTSITDIAKKAGVSRVSFYRNFQSKDDILVSKLDEAALDWWSGFSSGDRHNYALELFTHCMSIRDILLPMYEQGLSHLLWQNLNHLLGPEPADGKALAYRKSSLVGSLFGVIVQWLSRGMTDSPEQLGACFDASKVELILHSVWLSDEPQT
jgi:AcrR family transcriptional regulator